MWAGAVSGSQVTDKYPTVRLHALIGLAVRGRPIRSLVAEDRSPSPARTGFASKGSVGRAGMSLPVLLPKADHRRAHGLNR
jgi:hypothetical protein